MDSRDRKVEKQNNKILADQSIIWCYSMKGGYYERPGNFGYTEHLYEAGIFRKEDVCRWSLQSHGEIKPVPVNIDKHNKHIEDKIAELSNNIMPEQNEKYNAEVRRIAELLHTTWWQNDKDGIPHFGTVITTPEIWDQARAMVAEMAESARLAYNHCNTEPVFNPIGIEQHLVERGLVPSPENIKP